MIESKPRIWSGFEGTAVLKAHLLDPRNLTKYPLPEVEGYSDFLQGARLPDDTDGGQSRVEIAGIVTSQSDIFIRRMVTARSVAKLGLREFFPDRNKHIHTGHERLKAEHLIQESKTARTGMLEDRPHKLGAEILKIMAAQATEDETERLIVLGAVSSDKSAAYIEALVDNAKLLYGDAEMSEFEYQADENVTNVGHRIKLGKATLEVVQLARYSQSAGEHFGRYLLGPEPVAEPEHVGFGKKVGEFLVKVIGPEVTRIGRSTRRGVVRATTYTVDTLTGRRHVTIEPDPNSTDMKVSIQPVPQDGEQSTR